MFLLAEKAEQIAVFVLFVMLEGIFWTPTSFFAGANANLFANDPYSTGFFAALSAFLVIVYVLRAGTLLPLLRLAWPIVPLICFAYLSAYWSQFPELVLVRASKVAVTALFGIYLLSRGDLADLVSLFVKANLIAVVASFAVYFFLPKYAYNTVSVEYAHALRGAFADKNGLGLNAGLGVIFGVYAFGKRYGSRWASAAVVVGNLSLLALSQSKTPQILLFAALYVALLGVVLRRRNGLGFAAGFLLAVVGLAGIAIVSLSFNDVMPMIGRDPTLTLRTRIWHMVIPYIERRPWLGYGFGAFWTPQAPEVNEVWGLLQWRAPNAHNMWMQLALDLGVIGCLLAAFAWLATFGRAIRLLFTPGRAEVVFPLALLTAILVENITEYAFFISTLIWTLFCAVLVHLGRELVAIRAARGEAMPSRQLVAPVSPLWAQRV